MFSRNSSSQQIRRVRQVVKDKIQKNLLIEEMGGLKKEGFSGYPSNTTYDGTKKN